MAWFEHGSSRIYYEEAGTGDPVLFLPGLSDRIASYEDLRAILAANYRVIAADLPGSGRSGPQPRNYAAGYFEEDARAFIAFLQYLAVGPTHLTGFSDGGEVALLMAALEPAMARSLLVWGAGGQLSDPEGHLVNALHNVVDNPSPSLQDFHDYLIATYGKDNARAMTQSVAQAYREMIHAGGDISLSRVGNITCPTLIIVGENDFMAPPALVSQLAAAIPNAQTWLVEGAGHNVYGSQPDAFTQRLLDWFERH